MNARVADLVAGSRERLAAGGRSAVHRSRPQSRQPAGGDAARDRLGSSGGHAPFRTHAACKKFVERFGLDAIAPWSTPTKAGRCACAASTRGSSRAEPIRVGDRVHQAAGDPSNR